MAVKRSLLAAIAVVALATAGPAGAGTGTLYHHGEAAPAVVTVEAKRLQLEHVDALLARAARGSPAHLRLVEEHDRLLWAIGVADEVQFLGAVFSGATPGSPAQLRVREEIDRLRDQLR